MEIQYELTKIQEFFRRSVRDLAKEKLAPQAEDIDRKVDYPKEAAALLAENRLFALLIPKAYGGEEAGFLAFSLAIEELSKYSPTCAIICEAQNLGARLIADKGSKEQKQEYLSKIAKGQVNFGFALTEPEPVSLDFGASTLKAIIDGDNYIVNGDVRFIVNGDAAEVFSIFANTGSADSARAISMFLVKKNLPGFAVTKVDGMAGSEARFTCKGTFHDCRIPVDCLVGKEGDGKDILLKALPEVSCATAARSVGIAQAAVDASAEYATTRVQFGRPIGKFEIIQSMLADMATKLEAARQLVYKTASIVDQGNQNASKFAAMAKNFATDTAVEVTINAVQIHGGYGYMKDFPVERLMRNAKLAQITGITNQIEQLIIANSLLTFTQG
ncbi:MAG: acyl-CoA dehydrogenase family protein [Desulfobulbaceae bacterium]|nr:acyl-CoA dehydrogenase family protein [Desulfobulbaceae bacterium]